MVINCISKKTPRKILIIFFEPELCPEIKKAIERLALKGEYTWQILAVGYPPYIRLCEKGVTIRHYDSYFVEEEHCADYSQAIGVATDWFLNAQGNDVTIYGGVSIGVILQGWMINFYNDFLSNVRTVDRVLKEEKPDEVWLYSSRSGKEWEDVDDPRFFIAIFYALAKHYNIICKEKTVYAKKRKVHLKNASKSFLQKCKSLAYSLVVSKILFVIKYYLVLKGKRSPINILIPSPQALNYIGTKVLESLLHDKQKNVYVWRGETTKQRNNLFDISPLCFFRREQTRKQVLARSHEQFRNFIELTDIVEFKSTRNLLKQVYEKQIESCMRDIIYETEQLELWFSRMKFHLVFSHTDTAIKERTVISVANRHKVPSIILQHGIAGHYWGFFPFIATRFTAWGEITRKWFERNGMSKERVCITGAANFDSYVGQARENQEKKNVEWCGMSNYLLYVTVRGTIIPTGFKNTEQDNVRLLDIILNTVETMPEKMLVIKVKPGDPQTQFYKSEMERRKLRNVCVVDRTDNRNLLNACALLITTYSTMAIEALIFEKPVIQLRFVNKKRLMKALARQGILCDEDVIPLATYGAALGVDYPEELKEAITKISKDEEVRKLLIERGKVFLEKYGYVRDGKATERMIECIETMLEHTA